MLNAPVIGEIVPLYPLLVVTAIPVCVQSSTTTYGAMIRDPRMTQRPLVSTSARLPGAAGGSAAMGAAVIASVRRHGGMVFPPDPA